MCHYFLYDDDDIIRFIKSNYDDDIYEAYSKLTVGASKADFFRYLVLYKEGGIYLDLDSAIHKNLDDLIEGKSGVISREQHENLYVQWMLIFSKNHPILKEVIENVKKNIMKDCKQNVLDLTGPHVYADSIKKIINIKDLWIKEDDEINNKLKVESDKYISNTYFYNTDYEDYATFKTDASRSLYWEKPHWRDSYSLKTYALIKLVIIVIIIVFMYKVFKKYY